MDVGGVGVYLGYLTQLSILVYCWLHQRFMTNWARFGTIASCSALEGYGCAKERAEKVQERLDSSHQSAALISGLSEFQRSQSWFTLTLQGTAIGALASNGSMFDADSLQEMHLTVDLLGDVAATGIICLTFGLYMLHAANKKSWYTTCLSVLALLISCVTWTMTRMTLDNLHHMRPTEHDLPACGGRSPATFCLKKDSHRFTYFEATSMGICILAMALMIIRQSNYLNLPSIGLSRQTSMAPTDIELNSIRRTRRRSTLRSTESKAERAIAQVAKYSLKLEIAEFVMAGLTLTMFVRLLTNGELSALNSSVSWTFGQLIAVTIWIPSILEYLYAALLGVSLAERKQVKHILPMEGGSYVDAEVGSSRDFVDAERWWQHSNGASDHESVMRGGLEGAQPVAPESIRGDAEDAASEKKSDESAEQVLQDQHIQTQDHAPSRSQTVREPHRIRIEGDHGVNESSEWRTNDIV